MPTTSGRTSIVWLTECALAATRGGRKHARLVPSDVTAADWQLQARVGWQRKSWAKWRHLSLTDPRKPPPADLREVRRVCRILSQEVLFYDASEHKGADESHGDSQVER